MKTNPILGVTLVLAAAALWGTTGTAQALSGQALPALWFGALRLVVAALFFAVFAAITLRGAALRRAPLPKLALLGAGLAMAVYNLTFFAGVRATGVAVGTAVALGSGPVWAGILQSLIARQVPPRGWWVGTLLAVAGGVLMTGVGSAALAVDALGIALCLASGLAYAVYTLANKQLVPVAPAATITLAAFSVAALVAVPAAWLDSGLPTLRAADLAAVLYVGVVTAGVAYLLFSHALHHVSAATGVTLALAEPVVAFVLALVVVGERPSVWAFAGLVLVIAGVAVVVRAELASAVPRLGASPQPHPEST